jgi:hypothetical protein
VSCPRSKKLIAIMQGVMEHLTMRLWTLSQNKQEFDRNKSLVDGTLKHSLTAEMLNAALPKQSEEYLGRYTDIVAIHDGSDIRKEHSRRLESLGKVRSLSGKVINGYQTFNTVLVNTQDKELRLFQSTPFSNRSKEYCSSSAAKEKRKAQEAAALEHLEMGQEISDDDAPQATEARIIMEHLRQSSQAVRATNPTICLTHVLDRHHDQNDLFRCIDEDFGDKFVIRLKISRNSTIKKPDGSVDTAQTAPPSPQEATKPSAVRQGKWIKLAALRCTHRTERQLTKVRIGKKVYQDARLVLEYDTVEVDGKNYRFVRVQYLRRDHTPIFPQPMLLLTNHALGSDADAQRIYDFYQMRSRIEEVFHFLKTTLGWEDIQVRDWASQQALIALCFFIGGYFYQIEHALSKNASLRHICELGGGKGNASRTFFLRGVAVLFNVVIAERYFRRNTISDDERKQLFDLISSTVP